MKPDLSIDIAGIKMKNPITVASGTFGYGPEYADLVDLNELGAITVKGISREPWDGNSLPRIAEVFGGMVNAIGLQNPGVEGFCEKYLPFLRNYDLPVIVNIWGKTVVDYAETARMLSDHEGIDALEVNISCPNIKEGGISFGTVPESSAEVISAVRKVTKLPIIPKLSPNVSDIKVFAKVAEEEGADAISLINTIPAMVIDIDKRRPFLANVTGGLSGPAIHPVAVKMVWEAASVVDIPVIAMGGAVDAKTVIEFLLAGATAVALGTINFRNPLTITEVVKGIENYMVKNDFESVDQIKMNF
ncbi:MAG: dihydroorotate dehydrogenase [Kiritimatiellae bacterium]|nr:dihydroorotate dehydrogenase [Kiritimatiellia bacterium]